MEILNKKTRSVLFLSLFILLVLLNITSADPYKPFLHDPEVPEEGKLELRGLFKANLFVGAATHTYFIDVPKGTNGLQPIISLRYNSHDTKGKPSNLGMGWSLTQDVIRRDTNFTRSNTSNDEFKLSLEGKEYDLVYVRNEGRFHTNPETFFYVSNKSGGRNEGGMYWEVVKKNGTVFRFGFDNMDINVTNGLGLGLGANIFITNNALAVNVSALDSQINSSADITLRGLSYSNVTQVFKTTTFTNSSATILATGTDCFGISCSLIGYNGGILQFNTMSLGSFAANGTG